jgi:c-di-GMP-binding flagellar brake protein YcgR
MNNYQGRVERRRYPRVKREISLKIKYDNYDTMGQTRDISCIGAYCTVNKHIPLFSKISIILLLPLNNPGKNDYCSVRCKGAVVRVEKSAHNDNEYNIAIYFNEISRSGKVKLSQYVQQHLWT